MDKKRILVLSHMFPNKRHVYLGNQVYERVMELKKKYDIRVVAPIPFFPKLPRNINPYYEYSVIPNTETVNSINVYHPRYLTFPAQFLYSADILTYYLGVKNLIKKIYSEWKFDLIDAHQIFPDGYVATKIAKELSSSPKVVITIHGADAYVSESDHLRRLIIKKGLENADKVIAVSNAAKKRITKYIPNKKVKVIPIGINIKERIIRNEKIEKKVKGRFTVLIVGNLIIRKGHIYLLKAIKKLSKKYKNILCIIVGSGPELKNLKDFVNENRLKKYVYFAGSVSNKDVFSYFHDCSVFALPSWNEALGIVYMEAMTCGKPVIGCKGEGVEELITHCKEGFLIEKKNVNQIVNYIEKLILDRELLKKMGLAAKIKAKTSFKLTDRIKITEKLLNSLMEEGKVVGGNYKNFYSKKYYDKQGKRFKSKYHNIFGIYFKKFNIREPILDLGCGTGLFMEEARDRGFKEVFGIDISKYAIKKARRKKLEARVYNGKKIPFKKGSFNTIFCYQVIEHIPRSDANKLLKECCRVLKKGGVLLLFAPADYGELYNTDPTHINFYTIDYFKEFISEVGFKISSFESTMYLPSVIRNFEPYSYILSKILYKIFRCCGTTIELRAVKV